MTQPDWLPELTADLTARVDPMAARLIALSHDIHDHPELGFAEHHASRLLVDTLTEAGFSTTTGIAEMPTAFRAERVFGTGGPTIAVFCEFDALPEVGHACGHNIIATAGLGAALAVASRLEENGGNGRLLVLGSPAEEGGGGKVRMAEVGELSDVDIAVMVHPAGFDAVSRTNLGRLSLEAVFTGRASHAAAAPERGLNALDAATLLLVAIGLLRQQLRTDSRLHANIAEGGDAINVIPERSRVTLFIRSPDLAYLRGRLYEGLRDCVRGAAIATGTTYQFDEVAPAYDPVRTNPVLADLATHVFTALGRPIDPVAGRSGNAGSTDMGNISQLVPAIHPYICVTPGLAIHTRDFATAAREPDGDRAVRDGACLLASIVAALFDHPELVARAKAEFAS
ncbi:MAG TPA: M20 family metallopeptidase [Pseudonocardiaceae bacterium]|jgi:amidohydrolase|nr:M20 family metallopeptidase [Pseudonocardiaceae bacterium]